MKNRLISTRQNLTLLRAVIGPNTFEQAIGLNWHALFGATGSRIILNTNDSSINIKGIGAKMLEPTKDWDDAFANSIYIDGAEKLPQMWLASAAAYRASGIKIDQDIAYGDHPRERFDLIWPDGSAKGLVVFIHGGFWMLTDKSYWTSFAEGARANGWVVCLPSYTIAPEGRVCQMTAQISAAIEVAASRVSGPLRITGHSAGGHLASRMICDDSPLAPMTLARIVKVQSISGLHDLRPLVHTKMNETLQMDENEAVSESPVLRRPNRPVSYTCWVGGGERPEFIRQTKLMACMWEGLDIPVDCVVDTQHDHFSVLQGLSQPDSLITQNLVGAIVRN